MSPEDEVLLSYNRKEERDPVAQDGKEIVKNHGEMFTTSDSGNG